jgi:hypothetical protein
MKFSAICSLLIACLVALGCTDPNVGLLSGTVAIDGKPVKNGSIAFFPVDGQSYSSGAVISDGSYSAIVPIGKMRVEIRVAEVVGEKKLYDAPNSPVQPLLAELLPSRYNDASELGIEVVAGSHERNFDLEID